MRYLTTEEIEKALKKIYEVEKYTTEAIKNMQKAIEIMQEDTAASIQSLHDELSNLLTRYTDEQIKRKNAMLELAKKADEGG